MRALFPGSFDPATPGHREVLRRSNFDEVIACVMINPRKSGRSSMEERLALLAEAADGLANVRVDSHVGLLVDYCYQVGVDVVIRGVRNAADLGYELPMVHLNREMTGIETVFMATDPSKAHISSSLVTALNNQRHSM
jgi:pantetheine-phosphate adenylyltransferase